MKSNNLNLLFRKKQWESISEYPQEDIIIELGFEKAIIIAYKLLYNKNWDDRLQEFSVQLLNDLKKHFAYEWNLNWRYDAFLGVACDIALKYDERYEAFNQALKNSQSPTPELLIELAKCCYCPGLPPISYEQSIELLEKSISIHPYKQAAILLKSIYSSKKDYQNEQYWTKMIEQIKDENLPSLEPLFLSKY
jgi:hypothetical protein